MTSDGSSAPKADALPGCATPRPAENLRFRADVPLDENAVHGKGRRNTARTDAESPELFPNRLSRDSWLTLLRRVRPIERDGAAWRDDVMRHPNGLPLSLGPFTLHQQRREDGRGADIWDVCCATRKSGEVVLLADHPDVFSAYHAMVDAFDAWQDIRPVEQIYFIGTKLERGHLIKVGYSRDPASRLRTLQTGHGERLRIFATIPGGRFDEQKYHRRWHSRRRQGEWFTIGDCIIKEVERIRAEVKQALT